MDDKVQKIQNFKIFNQISCLSSGDFRHFKGLTNVHTDEHFLVEEFVFSTNFAFFEHSYVGGN